VTITTQQITQLPADRCHPHLLRLPALIKRTQRCKSRLYNMMNPRSAEFDPTFPLPIRIGSRAVAWVESEVDEWLSAQLLSAPRAVREPVRRS